MSRTIVTSHHAEVRERFGSKIRYTVGPESEWPEMKDGLNPFPVMNEFKVGKPGAIDHPHRGYETATYILSGQTRHEDHNGHQGTIEAGGLQWMTAGKGVVHCEVPANDDGTENHGLQLWINLKKADKMMEPAFQELLSKDIPKPSKDGVTVAVIAGESLGVKSQVYTRTPTMFLDFKLEPGAKYTQAVPKGWNGFVHVLSGNVHLGPEDKQTVGKPHHTMVMGDGEGLTLQNKGPEKVQFVLIAGEPINEPFYIDGHFVMNTKEEALAAREDLLNGRNGFENAPTWKSSALAAWKSSALAAQK
ncbi:Hypp3782 [Branchiostoma lanceolatum]|uniref:Hypp3782 protein n=1 Tax=Branchiostoma lanceolatum TaxID=7740 RepID=A0A8K0A2L7_BRALA|nr:Hypp3782 [Branchiostoma lanceolatum]